MPTLCYWCVINFSYFFSCLEFNVNILPFVCVYLFRDSRKQLGIRDRTKLLFTAFFICL